MIVIYAEKPDVASKIAAALDKITLKDGTEVTYAQLELDSLRKRVVAQRTKDQYLKIHYMNDECFVIWGVGHLCSLKQAVDYDPNYRNWRNIPTPFLPNYEIKAEKRTLKLFQNAKRLFHQADLIVNATDDDREGELIFHYVYQLSGATTPFQRVVLHEQTEQGFREAFLPKNLKSEAQVRNIASAGCARANIDALYGWNLTKDMTLKFAPPKTVYSIGRVQTPTLRMLVDRENEILQFQPEDYYVLQGTFQSFSGEEYTGIHESKKIKDRSEAENLLLKVQGGRGTVTDVTAKDSYKEIPLLYDLAALQADANAMYGFSAAYTQKLAQSLYDKGYTTYPRTESRVLNDGMEPMVIKVLSMLQRQPSYQKYFAGRTYQIGGKRFFDSSKVDSHYAIVPTGMDVRTGKGITAEEGKLFDLIARSVIRLTYRQAVIRQMEVITEVNGECFHTKGTAIKDPQWICVGGDTAKIRLSVLHVNTEKNYVIIGLNTQEVNTQSGFGIYKLAFESKGALQIKKSSANTTITNGNNCYSLKGAEFGVYSDSACTKKVMTLTTKADGTTDAKEIDAGKYYVKETKAPKGYELDEGVKTVTVDTDNDEDNPAVVNVSDIPGTDPVRFEVKKVDKDTGKSDQQGDADLSGAQFTVKYYNDYYDSADKVPGKATRTWVLETKEESIGEKKIYRIRFEDKYKVSGDEFYKMDGKISIPYGTITIAETKAPNGYKLEDSAVSVNGATLPSRTYFTKVEAGKDLGTVAANFTVSDPTKNYGIQVWKSDKELDKSEAIGGKDHTASPEGATLEGTTFSIINRSTNSTHYKDKEIKPGEEVTKIKAFWDKTLKKYTAQTGNKDLPYGTYGVKEIASSTGYKMSDGSEKTVVCHGEDGHLYTPNDSGDLNIKNEVIRGDVEFIKREGRKQAIEKAMEQQGSDTVQLCWQCSQKAGELTLSDRDEDIFVEELD